MSRKTVRKPAALRHSVKSGTTTRRRALGVVGSLVALSDAGTTDMRLAAPSDYGVALRNLRIRADVSQSVCGEALGMGASGFQRYETKFGSRRIPTRVIEALIPLFVGKGDPPVTEAELWNLSELRDRMPATAHVSEQVRNWEQSDFSTDPAPKLLLRYVVERGTYRRAGVSPPTFGLVGIGMNGTWDQGKQWAARVIGPDAQNFRFEHGTILHCIDPDVVPVASIRPNAVVVAERRRDDLAEILLARVVAMTGPRSAQLRDSDGQEFSGDVLGLVKFHYTPLVE